MPPTDGRPPASPHALGEPGGVGVLGDRGGSGVIGEPGALGHSGDPDAAKRAFAAFPSGVAALADDSPTVMVVFSFAVGVSHDPPMVSFAAQHSSTTWPLLAAARCLGVSVLGEAHTASARQLASRTKESRFTGLSTLRTPSGAILLSDAPVCLECTVEHTYPAGDHDIVVLRVLSTRTDEARSPLIWHRQTLRPLTG